MKIVLIYITCATEDEAQKFSKAFIELKLAACVHRFPVHSVYRWEGKLQNDQEWPILVKTMDTCVPTIKNYIQENHSYKIPSILHWTVEANEDYGNWVNREL